MSVQLLLPLGNVLPLGKVSRFSKLSMSIVHSLGSIIITAMFNLKKKCNGRLRSYHSWGEAPDGGAL